MTNSLPKILITGGNGQLAQSLIHHSAANQFNLITLSRAELNITDPNSIQQMIQFHQPAVIINTAAYTAVDKAEKELELAMRANHSGASYLAKACQLNHIALVHLSTDYIFDGKSATAYKEEYKAKPVNSYGLSKWLGEKAVRDHCEQHIILRVSGVFSEYGNNFAKTILRLANDKKELRIVSDQISCPTYAGDIAGVILEIINHKNGWGTYHYSSKEALSWYDFAKSLTNTSIKPISSTEYGSAAKRPLYSVLNCEKIQNTFNIYQPSIQQGIEKILSWHINQKIS